jgi:hypothetical protein
MRHLLCPFISKMGYYVQYLTFYDSLSLSMMMMLILMMSMMMMKCMNHLYPTRTISILAASVLLWPEQDPYIYPQAIPVQSAHHQMAS